jgi:hypothetical protein
VIGFGCLRSQIATSKLWFRYQIRRTTFLRKADKNRAGFRRGPPNHHRSMARQAPDEFAEVAGRICVVRGHRVMLDSEAEIGSLVIS